MPDEPPQLIASGKVFAWLPDALVERLAAARPPDEDCSATIVRIAAEAAAIFHEYSKQRCAVLLA